MPSEGFSTVLSQVLLVPYVVWGVRMLSIRYRHHEEAGPITEAVTLLGVMLFLAVEVALLRQWMADSTVTYVFTLLGLMVSMAALYGHMAISFTSRLIVEAVSTGDDTVSDVPRMGPIEALERQQDFEGALQECYVLARIYPRDPGIHLHIAENLLQLQQPGQAAEALERAMKYVTDPEKSILLMNRLCEVFQRDLSQPQNAAAAMQRYLKRFPNSPYAPSLQQRMEGLSATREAWKVPEALASLDEAPVEEEAPLEEVVEETTHIALEPLEDLAQAAPQEEEPEGEPPAPASNLAAFGLASLEDTPLQEAEEEPASRPQTPRISLQALDDAPLEMPKD